MTIFIAGVVLPVVLHFLAPASMPWWPDTISLGMAFGVAAGLIAARFKRDREMNRRLWNAIKNAFRSV
jgi:hypothetical protein